MTTAPVIQLFASGEVVNDTIRATIKGVAAGKKIPAEQIWTAGHMSKTTYYAKLKAQGNENPFSAGEVAEIARALGVQIHELYSGLGGTFVPPTPTPPPDGGATVTPVMGGHTGG